MSVEMYVNSKDILMKTFMRIKENRLMGCTGQKVQIILPRIADLGWVKKNPKLLFTYYAI